MPRLNSQCRLAVAGIAATFIAPASAQDAQQIAPAIDAIIAKAVATSAACAHSDPAQTKSWLEDRRYVVAMLWAANFPASFVHAVEARTDPANFGKGGDAKDCSTPPTWRSDVASALKAAGAKIEVFPPTAENMTALRALVDAEAPVQGYMLNCLLLADPVVAAGAITDWAASIKEARATLEQAGYPRNEVAELMTRVEADKLIVRAPERAAMTARCKSDDAWAKRAYSLNWYGFKIKVREIATGKH